MRKDALYGGFAYEPDPEIRSSIPYDMFLTAAEKARDVEIRRTYSQMRQAQMSEPVVYSPAQLARFQRRLEERMKRD